MAGIGRCGGDGKGKCYIVIPLIGSESRQVNGYRWLFVNVGAGGPLAHFFPKNPMT